ncbi:DUF7144 family membrane protein [Micromonospora endophytica]|uniref:DUF7144 domain-containing protein n=1 Tax=Micromonospora endophytica TaxID=515350 RepID=A0A2W2CHT1_9ACTN|nr:hypothetical protein [Micromonospora endophytica]PZF98122.1 hypothetical protein C1I93_09765 [Micromonospora endophytica]RIW42449.1 hypothetical protein D3H59_23055 [Micromonospora endophytica]BCJ57692.1 hypothetical protein Jiend_11140 [Micromonospora endophytica]
MRAPVADDRTVPPARPWLASTLLTGAGLVDILTAYANTLTDPYVVLAEDGTHHLDITGWAWLHLAVGVATLLAGLAVLTGGRRWALVGIGAAVAGIGTGVVLLPYQPVRAVIAMGLYAVAVRLLVRRLRARADEQLPASR